jgi:hypothetical protein
MVGDLALLEDQLSSRPFVQLSATFQRFPGHDHYNVLPAAVAAGLHALLPAS